HAYFLRGDFTRRVVSSSCRATARLAKPSERKGAKSKRPAFSERKRENYFPRKHLVPSAPISSSSSTPQNKIPMTSGLQAARGGRKPLAGLYDGTDRTRSTAAPAERGLSHLGQWPGIREWKRQRHTQTRRRRIET